MHSRCFANPRWLTMVVVTLLFPHVHCQQYLFGVVRRQMVESGGYVHSGILVEETNDNQVILRAKIPMNANQLLLRVPMSLSINREFLKERGWHDVFKNNPFQDDGHITAYYIALAAKRSLKSTDLPISLRFTSAHCFDGSDLLQELQRSPGAFPEGALYLDEFRDDDAKYNWIEEEWQGEHVSRDQFKWGMCMTRSRSFATIESFNEIYGNYVQLPLADLFNHANEPNVRMGMTADGNAFEFYLETNVLPGDELLTSYLDCRPPEFMLTHYGFYQYDHCFGVIINGHMLEYDTRFTDVRFNYAGFEAPTFSQWEHADTVRKILALCQQTLSLYPERLPEDIPPLTIKAFEDFRLSSRRFLQECIRVCRRRLVGTGEETTTTTTPPPPTTATTATATTGTGDRCRDNGKEDL